MLKQQRKRSSSRSVCVFSRRRHLNILSVSLVHGNFHACLLLYTGGSYQLNYFLGMDVLIYVQGNSTGNDHRGTTVGGEAATQQGRRHEAEAAAAASAASSSSSPVVPGVAARQRQTYPDIMDIAGMDYSPAARKPPIHN